MDITEEMKANLKRAQNEQTVATLELTRLQKKLSAITACVETWEKALEIAQKSKVKTKAKRKPRTASGDWRSVFDLIARLPHSSFGYGEIMTAAESLNIKIQRDSVRTKMMAYANKGYVNRIEDGFFQITSKGEVFFGLLNTGAKEPSLESGLSRSAVGASFTVPFKFDARDHEPARDDAEDFNDVS